jgi:hypothetical protein
MSGCWLPLPAMKAVYSILSSKHFQMSRDLPCC